MATKSLKAQGKMWANAQRQQEFLVNGAFASGELPTFREKLSEIGMYPLRPSSLEIFQVNFGKMCNQVCSHCHVDAGPDRTEIMSRETMELVLQKIEASGAHTLDITGGAPEMNPHFRWFVEQASALGIKDFIVRCNLTIIVSNKKYFDLPEFFARHKIHVVSSLPFYKKDRTDKQRGEGVFDKSIRALELLNAVGYGKPDSGLILDLVYNPAGAFLPAGQQGLENDYKKSLKADFNIDFNHLFAITNIPISRYLDYLVETDNYDDYMELLVSSFNPSAVQGVMCRNTISIGWEGSIYDCDFNQMLELKTAIQHHHIRDFDLQEWLGRNIVISQHCFGCTAGAGSSCQGTTL